MNIFNRFFHFGLIGLVRIAGSAVVKPLVAKAGWLVFVGLLWLGALALRADDRYVALDGTNDSAGGYTNWSGAATQIQWAVDAALSGETVWVSNGVYALTNQIVITSAITLRSTNGPDVTIINGNYPTYTNRCLLISNAAALVSGLTFSNGVNIATVDREGGGGVRMYAGIMSNCTVRNNVNFSGALNCGGGGVFIRPSGTAVTCRVIYNIADSIGTHANGAGVYISGSGSLVLGCIISNNTMQAPTFYGNGGGGTIRNGATIRSSTICNNHSIIDASGSLYSGGGGLQAMNDESSSAIAIIDDCTIIYNHCAYIGGGCQLNAGTTVTNCVISHNQSDNVGVGTGVGINNNNGDYPLGVFNSTIAYNTPGVGVWSQVDGTSRTTTFSGCNIISNGSWGITMNNYSDLSTSNPSNNSLINCTLRGNVHGASLSSGMMRGCLIVNNAGEGVVLNNAPSPKWISGCTIASNLTRGVRIECTNAMVSSCIIYTNGATGTDDISDARAQYIALKYSLVGVNPGFTGAGIIVGDPRFEGFVADNYRLVPNSPCINTGSNETWMTGTVDLDGHRRIDRVTGLVDMGAYELIPKITLLMGH